MKNLLYLTLGYTVLKIPLSCIKQVLNISNAERIKLISVVTDDCSAKLKIYTRDEKKLKNLLDSCLIEYEFIYRKGIIHLLKKYKHRIGMILGLILFLAVMYISPLFIWEINVSGAERLSRDYICNLIEKEGVKIGAFSPAINRQQLYINILKNTDEISWISVNFIGSSANVEIIERDFANASVSMADGANIVADKDGIIVDANITSGRQYAKKGTVVKKGDILVSGVYDTKKMGTRYVYSMAEVFAIVNDEYKVEIPLNNQRVVYKEETVAERTIKMFGKSINIFKNYSISTANYDIIYRKENIPFSGFDDLPISFETVSALPYEYESVIYTEEEALALAKREFYKQLDTDAEYTEIISIEECYTVENAVLILICNVEAVENIAATVEFSFK